MIVRSGGSAKKKAPDAVNIGRKDLVINLCFCSALCAYLRGRCYANSTITGNTRSRLDSHRNLFHGATSFLYKDDIGAESSNG